MKKILSRKNKFLRIYNRLYKSFGSQSWWPAETPFEVIIGAILTQNTNWRNVEKAIVNLKSEGLLNSKRLHRTSVEHIGSLIKPAGYFNVKAKRLKNFLDFFFAEYNGKIEHMRKEKADVLRKKLLEVKGIGPETADCILLYALEKPAFVVDTYTKRLLYRHGLIDNKTDYYATQDLLVKDLPQKVKLFNEYHALIVELGKRFCKSKPECQRCPLNAIAYDLSSRCGNCYRVLRKKEECFHCRPGK